MRLALTLPYTGDIRAGADLVARLEGRGLDLVWVPETWGADAPSQMGYLAARTERVQIGAGVLPVFSRSPALIAQTAVGVDALSGGRCVLGLGASGPQVVEGWHGVAYDHPVARLRETIAICRTAWAREALTAAGPRLPVPLPPGLGTGLGKPLRLLVRPSRPAIPVYVAALGPASVALAAEVADGWSPIFFSPAHAGRVWGEALAAGRARRAPSLGPLEVCAGGVAAVGGPEAVAAAREVARGELALYVGGMGAPGRNFYNDLAGRYGFAGAAREVQRLFLSGRRDEARAAVPDALVDAVSLCGDEEHVRSRLAAYRAAGVTVLNVSGASPDLERLIARLSDLVGVR